MKYVLSIFSSVLQEENIKKYCNRYPLDWRYLIYKKKKKKKKKKWGGGIVASLFFHSVHFNNF